MAASAPGGGTFDNLQYVPFLVAGGVVVGGIALVDHLAPQYAAPAAVAVVLGVALVWKDGSGVTAGQRAANVLSGALAKLQSGAGLAPSGGAASGAGGTATSSPAVPQTISNPLAGLNRASIFGQTGGGGYQVTTPYHCGTAGSNCSYSFGGLTVHRGIDIIPRGLSALQSIGQNVVLPVAGTFVAAIAGSPEQRGIVVRMANGLYEHLYHIDPASFTPGQQLAAGTTVGTIAAMSGPHVHYEIRSTATTGGTEYDPTPYLGQP